MEAENLLSKPRTRVSLKLIAQVVIFVILAILPTFVTSPYHLSLLITIGMYSVLAMGFVLVLRTGLITLGIAAFYGVGAYASAMMVMKGGMSFWVALPAAAIMTGLFAWFFGFLFIRNPGFSFIIMTMLLNLLFVVAVGSTQWLGGYTGVVDIPAPNAIHIIPFLPPLEFTSVSAQYYLMLFLFLVSVVIFSAFYASSVGRAWTAIGLNPQLASSLGINVFRYRVVGFVVASAVTGLIGAYYAHFIGCLHPDTFNLFKTIYVHMYAIVGSVIHALLGPSVGSTVMVFFPEFMRVTREIEPIITGLLLIIFMIFLPSGLLSLPGVRAFATDPRGVMGRAGKAIKSLGARK